MGNLPSTANQLSITGSPLVGQAIVAVDATNATWQNVAGGGISGVPNFNETSIKTAAYTAAVNDLVLADTTSGAFSVTLPSSPPDKSIICVKKYDATTANLLTVACGVGDSFTSPSGTSLTLRLLGQSGTWVYNALTHKWTSTGNGVPLAYLVDNFSNQSIDGDKTFNGNISLADTKNIIFGSSVGSSIGGSASEKLSFHGSTPIIKPTGNIPTALSNLGLISTPTISESDITGLIADLAAKQNTVSLTTTGTSGVATFNPTTGALNIPSYTSGGGSSSPLTTKGDIWVYGPADTRLPAGTDGYGLVADSAQTTGLKWAALAGSGNMNTTTYDPAAIAQQMVGTTATQTVSNKIFSGYSMADGTDIVLTSTTGTKIGTATTQKLGFFAAAPVVQQTATTDLGVALSNLGLRAAGTAYPITTSGSITSNGTLTTNGPLAVASTLRAATATRSAAATLTSTSTWNNLCNATTASFTITLPAASAVNGQTLWFKKIDATANIVSINRAGASDTIDGATSYALSTQYKYVELVNNGVDTWYVRSNN